MIRIQKSNFFSRPEQVLDKGIVIDAFVKIWLAGIDWISIETRGVIASLERHLKNAEAVGLTASTAIRAFLFKTNSGRAAAEATPATSSGAASSGAASSGAALAEAASSGLPSSGLASFENASSGASSAGAVSSGAASCGATSAEAASSGASSPEAKSPEAASPEAISPRVASPGRFTADILQGEPAAVQGAVYDQPAQAQGGNPPAAFGPSGTPIAAAQSVQAPVHVPSVRTEASPAAVPDAAERRWVPR